jgi:hypothetical protein
MLTLLLESADTSKGLKTRALSLAQIPPKVLKYGLMLIGLVLGTKTLLKMILELPNPDLESSSRWLDVQSCGSLA